MISSTYVYVVFYMWKVNKLIKRGYGPCPNTRHKDTKQIYNDTSHSFMSK